MVKDKITSVKKIMTTDHYHLTTIIIMVLVSWFLYKKINYVVVNDNWLFFDLVGRWQLRVPYEVS